MNSLNEYIDEDFNWQRLLRASRYHGVLPQVYWTLKTWGLREVPENELSRFEEYFYLNCSRNLRLSQELLEILALFQNHDIMAVSFKGPALAVSAYGNLAFRQFADLDILVSEQDAIRCKKLLMEKGYKSKFQLSGSLEKLFIKSNHTFNLICDTKDVMVEIHWRFTPRYFGFDLQLADIKKNLNRIVLGNEKVNHLPPEEMLLVLCVHGTKHCWNRLSMIADVSAHLQSSPKLDWDKTSRLAKGFRMERMLGTGLALSGYLTPSGLTGNAAPGQQHRLAREFLQQCLAPTKRISAQGLQRIPFHLKSRERIRDRILYLLRLSIVPDIDDFRTLALPSIGTPVYALIRPLRLFMVPVLKRAKSILTSSSAETTDARSHNESP